MGILLPVFHFGPTPYWITNAPPALLGVIIHHDLDQNWNDVGPDLRCRRLLIERHLFARSSQLIARCILTATYSDQPSRSPRWRALSSACALVMVRLHRKSALGGSWRNASVCPGGQWAVNCRRGLADARHLMTRKRIEPVWNESAERPSSPEPLVLEAHHGSGWNDLLPVIKLASLAVILASVIFIADRAYQRYQAHRAAQQAMAFIEQMEAELASMGRQVQAHQSQKREARASSAQGRWMYQNCQDWRRSFGDSRLPTAREEMLRHCRAYERYLSTGQVAAEFRMPRS